MKVNFGKSLNKSKVTNNTSNSSNNEVSSRFMKIKEDNSQNVENLLRFKFYPKHKKNMKEYLKRVGLGSDIKVNY